MPSFQLQTKAEVHFFPPCNFPTLSPPFQYSLGHSAKTLVGSQSDRLMKKRKEKTGRTSQPAEIIIIKKNTSSASAAFPHERSVKSKCRPRSEYHESCLDSDPSNTLFEVLASRHAAERLELFDFGRHNNGAASPPITSPSIHPSILSSVHPSVHVHAGQIQGRPAAFKRSLQSLGAAVPPRGRRQQSSASHGG